MKITAVESSTLAAVGYDEGGAVLQLEFRGGALYRYFAVPSVVHESLLAAASKGRCFNQAIRGRYQFVQVGRHRLTGGVSGPVESANQRGPAWPAR